MEVEGSGRGHGRKKSDEILKRLIDLYPREVDKLEDFAFPEILHLNDPDLSVRVLEVLEAVEWRWTVLDVLAQPDDILSDVLYLRYLGLSWKNQK